MRKSYHRKKQKIELLFRKNTEIRVPEVRVIDHDGNILGVLPTAEAIQKAQDAGFDLVEVQPKAQPPVTKFIDYGSYRFNQEKLRQKQKAGLKKIDIKGVRLSLRIGSHDEAVRLRQAITFLEDGDRIRIELSLRGRERMFKDDAKEKVQAFFQLLEKQSNLSLVVESSLKWMGDKFSMVIAKKGTPVSQ